MSGRLSRYGPAVAGAVAGAVAVRRSQRGWDQPVAATGPPVDGGSCAVLARPDTANGRPSAPPGPSGPGTGTGPPAEAHQEPIPSQTGESPGPDSPLELPLGGWKASLKRTAKEFKDDRATLTAAGMAFYWFLAVFPAMLAAVGLLGLVNASQGAVDSITRAVQSALPGQAATVLVDTITSATEGSGRGSLVATLVGVALALWSASAGMVGLQMGLNVAYDVTTDRSFVKKRLVAFELLAATLVLGGLATALIVFGAPLGDALRDNLPLGGAFVVAWTLIRLALGITALILLFATVYYLAPNRDTPRWVWVSPGGLVAAAIWLAASFGFSFYVSSFGKYGETYGSLAGVVVLLLWLYLTALAVVLGGELNAELERQNAADSGQVEASSAPR